MMPHGSVVYAAGSVPLSSLLKSSVDWDELLSAQNLSSKSSQIGDLLPMSALNSTEVRELSSQEL